MATLLVITPHTVTPHTPTCLVEVLSTSIAGKTFSCRAWDRHVVGHPLPFRQSINHSSSLFQTSFISFCMFFLLPPLSLSSLLSSPLIFGTSLPAFIAFLFYSMPCMPLPLTAVRIFVTVTDLQYLT